MTTAMILCAGLGTRLRPLTDELPKPLVWLGDRPLVAHIAARLAEGGVRRAVLNTHHLAERFDAGVLASLPLEGTTIREETIAGTAGGLAGAASLLGEGDVIVWNGDVLVDVDVGALVETHRRRAAGGLGAQLRSPERGPQASTTAIATLVVTPNHPTEPRVGEGTVGLAEDGSVVRLRGKRFGREARGADFVGVHVVGAALRARLPREGCLVGDVYLPELGQGRMIGTFEVSGGFRDLGTVEAYLAENRRWLEARGERAWIGPGAVVDSSVDIEGSIIGAGAIVRGKQGSALRGVVVWPGATAHAPLEHAVVLPSGRIARP